MSSTRSTRRRTVKLYTIGSNEKSAETFFTLIMNAGVRRIIDVRLKNNSSLLGFTRQAHLPYLLRSIAGIHYEHRTELAPDEGILDPWKAKAITWPQYEERFVPLLRTRQVERALDPNHLDRACLLCAEPTAEQCHRRLVAEYLRDRWAGRVRVDVIHLPRATE